MIALGIAVLSNITATIAAFAQWQYLWTIPYLGFITAFNQFFQENTIFWQKDIELSFLVFLILPGLGKIIFMKKN